MANETKMTKLEAPKPKEKTFSKRAFLNSSEFKADVPLLYVILEDGKKYTKQEVILLINKAKNKEVNNG